MVRRSWRSIRITRLPGGGESRDIWRLGPVCVKRWSPRISPVDVRRRCRVSREIPICNPMWYMPWLHWTVARWVVSEPPTHEACNRLLGQFPGLRDLHVGQAATTYYGAIVADVEGPK